MPGLETLYAGIGLMFDVIGVFTNLLLGIAIYLKPNKDFDNYSALLLNSAFSDGLTCLVSLFVAPRFISAKVCFVGMGGIVALYAQIAPVLLYSFVYRFLALRNSALLTRKAVHSLLLASWCYPTILFISVLSHILEHLDYDMSRELLIAHPELNLTGLVISAAPHISSDPRGGIPTLAVVVAILPFFITSIILRYLTIRRLERATIVSANTRRLNQTLLRALTYQIMLPLMFFIAAGIFWADRQFQIHSTLLEYAMVFFAGIAPILSPFSSFIFIRPYREWLLGLILCRNCRKPIDSSVHTFASHQQSSLPNSNHIAPESFS